MLPTTSILNIRIGSNELEPEPVNVDPVLTPEAPEPPPPPNPLPTLPRKVPAKTVKATPAPIARAAAGIAAGVQDLIVSINVEKAKPATPTAISC